MFEPSTPELIDADHAISDRPAFAPPIATNPEVLYRHAGWQARRDKIRFVLSQAKGSASRCERWDNCGACATVEHSRAREKHRICCWHCKDRWCSPCQTAKRCELIRIINLEPATKRRRFITLTLRFDGAKLKPRITRLKKGFRKLTKSAWWKARVVGGVAVLEVKIGKGGNWHPHLHAIVDADWMDKNELSQQWKIATGDSFIVDIRDVKNPEHAAGYLAKYMTKGVDADVINNDALLLEALDALRGARSYDVFGSWRGERTKRAKASATRDPDEGCCPDFIVDDWKTIASLREYVRGIQSREPWAIAIQTSLQASRYARTDSG